jgi:hypothetical protein
LTSGVHRPPSAGSAVAWSDARDTFDATTGDFLGETLSPENGPHSDLDSGFALFCDVIVPALT